MKSLPSLLTFSKGFLLLSLYFPVFLLGLGGCTIQSPSLSLQDVNLRNLSLQSADLIFDIKIDNPNSVGITFVGYDYDLTINNKEPLQGRQDARKRIEPSQSTLVTLPFKIEVQKLYNAALSFLANTEKPTYKALFHLYFDLPFLGEVGVPFSEEGQLELAR
jgi:LEA14-like dessication related protein